MTLWYMGAWVWSLPLVVLLSFRVRPIELVFYGILIDAQYMMYADLPWYTLSSAVWFLVVEWIKPYIAVYTHRI